MAITFWYIMTIAVMVWYSTITIYVAIRGGRDIKHMLGRLEQIAEDDRKAAASQATPH